VAGDDAEEVTAFWMAHEWGHHVLGHPQMVLSRVGQWLMAMSGSANEDAADRWAGRFLSRNKYDIAPVLAFLCSMPGGGPGDSHSSGETRARNTARAYRADEFTGCEDDSSSGRPPAKDFRACMQERVGICMESCQTSWGYPYARCVTLCSLDSPNNQRVWEPLCRKGGSTLLRGGHAQFEPYVLVNWAPFFFGQNGQTSCQNR
jgi:hypothetical protein